MVLTLLKRHGKKNNGPNILVINPKKSKIGTWNPDISKFSKKIPSANLPELIGIIFFTFYSNFL
jgi:hypothetical protein